MTNTGEAFSKIPWRQQAVDQNRWYAIRVRAHQETIASLSLRSRGLEEFLPVYDSRRRWTDRVKAITIPLFSGYVFCRFSQKQKVLVLEAAGCLQIVKCGADLAPLPDEDIQALKRLVDSGLASPCPYVREGSRVRIRAGAFENIEGYVQKIKNRDQLIVSLHLLQRSVSVQLEADIVQVL